MSLPSCALNVAETRLCSVSLVVIVLFVVTVLMTPRRLVTVPLLCFGVVSEARVTSVTAWRMTLSRRIRQWPREVRRTRRRKWWPVWSSVRGLLMTWWLLRITRPRICILLCAVRWVVRCVDSVLSLASMAQSLVSRPRLSAVMTRSWLLCASTDRALSCRSVLCIGACDMLKCLVSLDLISWLLG